MATLASETAIARWLLVLIPVVRALLAPLTGVDPLGPVGRLLAAHPWIERQFPLPIDQARDLSQSLTLAGVVIAILCGFAASRLGREIGLGPSALAPAIAYEFAPGLPPIGFDPAGLVLLALPILLSAVLRTRERHRGALSVAGAVVFVSVVADRDAALACVGFAALLAVPALQSDRSDRRRARAGRLLAGFLLGVLFAFPLATLHLLSGLAPLPAFGLWSWRLVPGRGGAFAPWRIETLLPLLGVAATAFAVRSGGGGRLTTAVLGAVLAGGIAGSVLHPGTRLVAPIAAASMLLAASALRGAPAWGPARGSGSALRLALALLAAIAVTVWTAVSGGTDRVAALTGCLVAVPALTAIYASRVLAGLALVVAVAIASIVG